MSSLMNFRALQNAKTNEEPFVAAVLTENGYHVEAASFKEDLKGTDLKVSVGQFTYSVDVKGSTRPNQKSNHFLFVPISGAGKEYPYKENGYFAFVDYNDYSVTLISHNAIRDIVATSKHFTTKYNNKSQYVLLNKQKIKDKGVVYYPSDAVKQTLKI